MVYTKADNIQTIALMKRLQKFISLRDACLYIGIQITDLARLRHTKPSNEYLPEEKRDLQYHLGKIKSIIEKGINKPIDIDCLVKNNHTLPFPIILDGRHRYIAAILRSDGQIPITYSGRQDLLEYLTGESNTIPSGG